MKVPEQYVRCGVYHDVDRCAEETRALLALPQRPTCIIFPDDFSALGGYNALAEAGRADTVRLDGQQLFCLCGDDGHHHHLVCTNCGKTVEIESPSESWLKGISDKYGFTIERHTLEVFGLCEDCRKADK